MLRGSLAHPWCGELGGLPHGRIFERGAEDADRIAFGRGLDQNSRRVRGAERQPHEAHAVHNDRNYHRGRASVLKLWHRKECVDARGRHRLARLVIGYDFNKCNCQTICKRAKFMQNEATTSNWCLPCYTEVIVGIHTVTQNVQEYPLNC